MRVTVFSNFNLVAFDDAGKQVADVQVNLLLLWAKLAAEKGYAPEGLVVLGADGQRWRIFKTDIGFNLEAT